MGLRKADELHVCVKFNEYQQHPIPEETRIWQCANFRYQLDWLQHLMLKMSSELCQLVVLYRTIYFRLISFSKLCQFNAHKFELITIIYGVRVVDS